MVGVAWTMRGGGAKSNAAKGRLACPGQRVPAPLLGGGTSNSCPLQLAPLCVGRCMHLHASQTACHAAGTPTAHTQGCRATWIDMHALACAGIPGAVPPNRHPTTRSPALLGSAPPLLCLQFLLPETAGVMHCHFHLQAGRRGRAAVGQTRRWSGAAGWGEGAGGKLSCDSLNPLCCETAMHCCVMGGLL